MPMQYRRLGTSGLQVSELSLGSWVTYHTQVDVTAAKEMLAAAMDAGVNFFDNAEVYAGGESEVDHGRGDQARSAGRASTTSSRPSSSGASSATAAVNRKDTLNRKYLMQAIDGSLERLRLDFVDLVFCHRPDPNTPIEETVWAMSDMIAQRQGALLGHVASGRADEIRAAWDIAERHHLHKPVMEQPQYNLFHRKRVEQEYARLYDDIGLGPHDLEPARQRPADRQVQRRHSRGQPRRAGEHALARERLTDAQQERRGRPSSKASPPSSARSVAPAGDRLGAREPARLDRDHRRVERRPAAREPLRGRRRCRSSRPR